MFGPRGIRNVECWVCLLNALNKLWSPTTDMCTLHELFNCLIVKILSVVKDLERVQLRTVFLKVYNGGCTFFEITCERGFDLKPLFLPDRAASN